MISSIVSRLVILVFGTLYPAYASYKAVRTKNVREYVKWMMYWIVFALFSCAETFTDVFLSFWFPFYYEIKILLVLWLLSPATKGSSILYRKFVHPMLSRREQDIDEYIAKAKEQGYHTVLHLGTKGVNYATTVIMQTAIKGGGGLVQQLRRSYSLGDLSSDVDGDSSSGRKALPEAQDRNRDRERVASGGDGRHHRPRGHSPRRSASGSGRVEMYFPEVDVDVRGPSVREPSVPLSHIRSSEDVSSGYSSAEPLYQHGGSVGGGQHGESRPDSLANSREPLVRTASVGGSSRSARTRSSRGGGGTVGKKGSSPGVSEDAEECSLGGEDSLDMSPPSPPHSLSRSNSLPASADHLRPELVALLQALNAELEQKVSMSKHTEMKMSVVTEQMEKAGDTLCTDEEKTTIAIPRTSSSSDVEMRGVVETSQRNVSAPSLPDTPDINTAIDSDDIFYDSVSVPPLILPNESQFKNEKNDMITPGSETVSETEGMVDDGPPVVFSPSPPDMPQKISEQHKVIASDADSDELLPEPVKIAGSEESEEHQHKNSATLENELTESTCLPENGISHSHSRTCVAVPSEAQEADTAHISDEQVTTNSRDLSTNLDKTDKTSPEKESCHDDGRETNQNIGVQDEISCDGGKHSDTRHVTAETKCDSNDSEQILMCSDGEMNTPNDVDAHLNSSKDRAATEQEDNITEDEFQDANDGKGLKESNNTSQEKQDYKQLSSSVASAISDDVQQQALPVVESSSLKEDSIKSDLDTGTVLSKSNNTYDSEKSLNNDVHIPENTDLNQDKKKDVRSGRYHKLQAPEPPPRSRRSSSKSSTSEDIELLKSGHRSHSPKKTTESPVAKLHGQIENLASMLPFWHSGKRSREKEIDVGAHGFRIREMSRSPTRRVGDQAPP